MSRLAFLIFLLSIAMLIVSYISSHFSDLSAFNLYKETPFYLPILALFPFSLLFFGYFAPLFSIFTGIALGSYETNTAMLGFALSILMLYSGIRLGDALWQDLNGKGNFRRAFIISLGIFVVAGIACLALLGY